MRGFMRAIGLGGLFKNQATSSATASARRQSAKGGRAGRGPAMGTLVPLDDIPRTLESRRSSGSTRSRHSSVMERPQFLFFCGSESSGLPANSRVASDFSFDKAEVQARASMKANKIETPVISHRIPVFFAPQQAMLHSFE